MFWRQAVLIWVLVWGWLGAQQAVAWSYQGHASIARQALAQLPLEQQRFFNRNAKALLLNDKAKKWRYSLRSYEPFALAAVWPDTRRDSTLHALFNRYAGGAMPPIFKPYAAHKTANWHYVNQQYWDSTSRSLVQVNTPKARCHTRVNGDLARVWPALLTAYQQAPSAAERGFWMAFISHLLADAYQPLHGLAALNNNCQHDAGGNAHCLATAKHANIQKKGRCKLSLHRVWDAGFGIFTAATLGPIKPAKAIDSVPAAEQLLPRALKTHGPLASFIYSAPPGQVLSTQYRAQAAHITQTQAQRAASELAALLAYLYAAAH
ncbi:S1/P1 nuclease [Marinagarivorans algicola]|uniref:S1/P1 nuclease n=1 Tax=Marinagarivorans algicola TaxID=1513270 RepID=UPI0037357628